MFYNYVQHRKQLNEQETIQKSPPLYAVQYFIITLFFALVYFLFKSLFTGQLISSRCSYKNFDNASLNEFSNHKLKNVRSENNSDLRITENVNCSKFTQPCQPIFLWGGGKAGSTTLATLLKHTYNGSIYNEHSQFIDLPKELCIIHHLTKHSNTKNNINEPYAKFYRSIQNTFDCPKKYVLDACPAYYSRYDGNILRILQSPPHENFSPFRFLMLIRDPVDRLISHLNENFLRRNEQSNITEQLLILRNTKKSTEWKLSLFGESLRNYFSSGLKREYILIIPMIVLTNNAQIVANAIMDFIGADPVHVQNLHVNKGLKESWSEMIHQQIDDTLLHILKEDFREDVKLLQKLVGYPIPWAREYGLDFNNEKLFQDTNNDLDKTNNKTINGNWLAVHPIGVIDELTNTA